MCIRDSTQTTRPAGIAAQVTRGSSALAITTGRSVAPTSMARQAATMRRVSAIRSSWSRLRFSRTMVRGANMPEGHVVALSGVPRDRPAVLEVDEVYLPQVVAAVAPRTIVLLNLSRDQLDRMAETRRIVAAWRAMLVGATERPVVIANADDPLVTWAAMPAGRVVWVGAGLAWRSDAAICPSCGGLLTFAAESWACEECPLRRPEPEVALRDGETGERGADLALRLAYAEVDHELVPGTDAALRTAKRRRDQHPAAGADDPDLDVVANYTAFQALRGTVAPVSGHQ